METVDRSWNAGRSFESHAILTVLAVPCFLKLVLRLRFNWFRVMVVNLFVVFPRYFWVLLQPISETFQVTEK